MALGVGLEGLLQFLLQRFRPRDVLDDVHALGVVDAFRLQRGDLRASGRLLLRGEQLARVVQDGLEHRDDVERVVVGLRIEQLQRRQREGGQRLIQREVALQLHRQARPDVVGAARALLFLDDAGGDQAAVELDRRQDRLVLLVARVMVAAQQIPHVGEGVAAAGDDVEQHPVADAETAGQSLRRLIDELVVGLLRPRDLALRRGLEAKLLHLRLVLPGTAAQLEVLDLVVRGLHHDRALGVVARTARATGDLVELAGLENALAGAVVLDQAGHQHRADGHVDAHAQRVGATDDLEQAGLRQSFDQAPVLRQHAGVVDADALAHQLRQDPAEGRREAEITDLFPDPLLLLRGQQFQAGQRLRALRGLALRKVHHVNGGLAVGEQLVEGVVDGRVHVMEIQRHRAGRARDELDVGAGALLEVLLEHGHVAERGRHEQELRAIEQQQRHLPCPPSVGFGVEVELVHDHLVDAGVGALAQRDVGHDLRGRAHDRRAAVDGRVTGHHADVLRPENVAQGEELLADQSLDRRGVETALTAGQRGEMRGDGHHRLSRTRRRGQDDVVATGQRQRRLLLRGVQRDAGIPRPGDEGVDDRVVDQRFGNVGEVGQHGGERHAVQTIQWPSAGGFGMVRCSRVECN